MYDGHWFGGGFMWIFWIALILIIFWGARSYTGSGASDKQSAIDILKKRYALGEINKDEYDAKKRGLL